VLKKMTIAEWRANNEFAATRALIVDERIVRIEEGGREKFRPEFTIRFRVDGTDYEVAAFDASRIFYTSESESRDALNAFDVGAEYPAWYDPRDPQTAVLLRGYSWYAWVLPLLPAGFVAVGFGGLIYSFLTWGKSEEHRSLLKQANLDLFDPQGSLAARYPTIPDDVDVRSSPGTTLRYRVPSVPVFGSFVLVALAVVWNVTVAWFVVDAVRDYPRPAAMYLYLPLLAALVVAGVYLAYLAARRTMGSWGIEPTIVEISDHPLYPGGSYDLHVMQTGRYQLNGLSVLLACDEEATFQQGTNSRTHQERVFELELYRCGPRKIRRDQPFSERIELNVPNRVMHTFQSTHNSVQWKIVVRSDVQKWPDVDREFRVIVCPGEDGVPPL